MTTHCTAVEPDSALQQDSAAAPAMPSSLRLVLDTNAVLDWLLFRDKAFAPISSAILSGTAVLMTSEACLEELRRVLSYPEFKLQVPQQVELLAQYCRHVQVIEVAETRTAMGGDALADGIPRCKDPDDQKFLQLAAQQAAMLVTKDKLLLQLARRVAKGGRFLVLRPDMLVRQYLTPRS